MVLICIYSGPGGVLAPRVEVLGASSLKVSWTRPINPNGLLTSYTIALPQPRFDVNNVSVTSLDVNQLDAYTLYSVTLTACSGTRLLGQVIRLPGH